MNNYDSELRFNATDVRNFLQEVNQRALWVKAGWATSFPQDDQDDAVQVHHRDFMRWVHGMDRGDDRTGEPDISDGELSEPGSEGGEVASESEDEERAQSDEEGS